MASATALRCIVRSGCRGQTAPSPSPLQRYHRFVSITTTWKTTPTSCIHIHNNNNDCNPTNRTVRTFVSPTSSLLWNGMNDWMTQATNEQARMVHCFSTTTSTSTTKEEEGDEPSSSLLLLDVNDVVNRLKESCEWKANKKEWNVSFIEKAIQDYQRLLNHFQTTTTTREDEEDVLGVLTSSEVVQSAFKASLKRKMDTLELSKFVRTLEKQIGTIGKTPLTEELSLVLLEANGKAGNVGRAMDLLTLRKKRGYPPASTKEFRFAVQSLQSGGLYLRRSHGRSIYQQNTDNEKTYKLDNPTRWLDAILLNMNQRNFQLTTSLANRMLNCYASTGKTSHALHFFYKIQPPNHHNNNNNNSNQQQQHVKMKMLQQPPPYHKVPSKYNHNNNNNNPNRKHNHYSDENDDHTNDIQTQPTKKKKWSMALTAAFAFAESLTHGACGHDPIQLNLQSYNILIKVCCYRGALWKALELLQTMPYKPDTYTYNTILAALARVGDAKTIRELVTTMTNTNVPMDSYTIQAIVDGFLNAGDISGAISWVQDAFNQHDVLPPYTTHLKILEFALANDLIYEAKRHVYFVQQLWKSTNRNNIQMMQNNPKLSKSSLQRLFAYFGHTLDDSDFF